MTTPTLTTNPLTITRVTVHSTKSFSDVTEKLYSSSGGPSKVDEGKKAAKSINLHDEASRKQFEDQIQASVGEHGFMIFQEFDHGSWAPLFGVGNGLKSKRIILGNLLIAITMLKFDSFAGLAVPVEILVREVEKNGNVGVEVVWNLPSGLIAGGREDERLREAAKSLDEKLETLVK